MHPIRHFITIGRHRRLVRRYCFRLGLIRQGLTHDLSKYSPAEFWRGARYYQGNKSPHALERRENGESLAWLHHKGRNRHHFEYWVDYHSGSDGEIVFGGGRMPKKYIAEMFCDRVAAARVYLGEAYTDAAPYEYYRKIRVKPIHAETEAALLKMLVILKNRGEKAAFHYVRKWLSDSR